MSTSSTSEITPAAAYMQYLLHDVKPRLFAKTRTIDATRTAFFRFVLNADMFERNGSEINRTPLTSTYRELVSCLKTSDDKKLFALLRREFHDNSHEVQKMSAKEAKIFQELKDRFSKRFETAGNSAYVANIRKNDAAERQGNWIEKIEKRIFKEVITHFLRLTGEKMILNITIDIEYLNLDDLETPITCSSQIQVKEQCKHCTAFLTTAHKLERCAKCSKVFYCNEKCANNDFSKHKDDCELEAKD